MVSFDGKVQNNNNNPITFENEIEYFGFSPLSFIDIIIESINRISQKSLDSLSSFVFQLTSESEAERGIQLSSSLLESCIDKNFDRWELYCLEKIFKVIKDDQQTSLKKGELEGSIRDLVKVFHYYFTSVEFRKRKD